MTKTVRERHTPLHERLTSAQADFLDLDQKICGLKAVTATMALLRLTAAIFERYEDEKRARAAVDFDDLIERTISLLSREETADWVLYQLDSRIDHILIDEAQDTSPAQWRIVELLTQEFFSGHGARACVPTLFAVGDEKQSIYGFQGARPEELQRFGAIYEKKARAAGFPWRAVDLGLSFRTLAPVLDAVDRVTGALPGLRDGERVPHAAYRCEAGGLVELWEPEQGEKEEKGSVWETEAARAPQRKPAEALAARIAATIKHWLLSGEMLCLGGPACQTRRHPDPASQARADGAASAGRAQARGRARVRRRPHGACSTNSPSWISFRLRARRFSPRTISRWRKC